MPVLPQLRPSPGTALPRRGPATTTSSSYGNTQDEEQMKIAEEEGTSGMMKNQEKLSPEGGASPEKELAKDENETKKRKRIRFVEPPKEETQNIPTSEETSEGETDSGSVEKETQESSEEESESSSEGMVLPDKKTNRPESSEEESESSSEEMVLPDKKTNRPESSEEESDDSSGANLKVVNIAIHQIVPKSLKPPPVAKKVSSEEVSSSEKESSSSEDDDTVKSTKYAKLHESHSEEHEVAQTVSGDQKGIKSSPEAVTPKSPLHEAKLTLDKERPNQGPLLSNLDKQEQEEDLKELAKDTNDHKPSSEPKHSFKTPLKRQHVEAPNKYSTLVPSLERLNDDKNLDQKTEEKENDVDSTSVPSEVLKVDKMKIDSVKTVESVQRQKVFKKPKPRLFFKFPNEDAVVIPLHGSSDEEADKVQTEHEPSESPMLERGTEEDEPNKYAVIVPLYKSPFEKSNVIHEENKSQETKTSEEFKQAGGSLEKSDLINNQKKQVDKNPKKVKHKIFTKIANVDAVYVPLHGSSDEEGSGTERDSVVERDTSENGQASSATYHEEPNKYSVLVPLRGLPGEQENIFDAKDEKSSLVDPTELGNIKTNPDDTIDKHTEKDETTVSKPVIRKQRLFFKVPNQNAVIIPLHGSSDEEDKRDIDEDDGLRTPPAAEKHSHQERKSSKVVYEGAPNEYGIIVPLAGFPDEEVFASEENVNVSNISQQEEEPPSKDERDEKNGDNVEQIITVKKKQRVFLKVPNENAVYVPLHGSSDEEEVSTQTEGTRERSESICETPKIQTIQRIYAGAPNEYAIFVPLHSCPEEHNVISERGDGQPSSLVESCSDRSEETAKDSINKDKVTTDESLNKNVVKRNNRKPGLFFKIPHQDAVIVPLHGSSDEEDRPNIDEDDDGLIQTASTMAKTSGPLDINESCSPAPNEYSAIAPSHGLPRELEISVQKQNTITKIEPVTKEIKESIVLEEKERKMEKTSDDSYERKESEKQIKKKQRIFVKVPNQDAVIVPLHGSSDEEVKLSSESLSSQGDREESKEKSTLVETVYEQAPNEYGILVPLHGLPDEDLVTNTNLPEQTATEESITLEDKSSADIQNLETKPADSEETKEESTKPKKRKSRLFYKIPNENAFLVPLHGSSDEEETERKEEGGPATGTGGPEISVEAERQEHIEYEEAPNEYGLIVPLHKFPYEPKSYEEDDVDSENESVKTDTKPNLMEVGEQTLVTSSDISDERKENQKKIKKKQRIFVKVPNQDAVIVPLHGSSDEDEKADGNEDVELSAGILAQGNVQENIEKPPVEEIVYDQEPNEYGILVPLHGLPGEDLLLNTNRPEATVAEESSALDDKSIAEIQTLETKPTDSKETKEDVAKPKRRKSRLFYKIPNENAYLVPLHGSSDEEEREPKDEEDGLSGPGEPGTSATTADQQHVNEIIEYEGAPNEYSIIVPLNKFPYEPKSYEEEEASLVPSPITDSSTKDADSHESADPSKTHSKEENIDIPVNRKQRIFLKVPNQDAVYVPLHGSSDEDEGSIRNEETTDTNSSVLSESLSRIDDKPSSKKGVKDETGNKEDKKPKAVYVGAPNEYAIFVPLHGAPDEEKLQDISEPAISTTEVLDIQEVNKDNDVGTPKAQERKTRNLEKLHGVMESGVPSESQASKNMNEGLENQKQPKETPGDSKSLPTDKKELKPKRLRKKAAKKELLEEKTPISDESKTNKNPQATVKKPPTTTKPQIPFKMADVVLQLMSKKQDKDPSRGEPEAVSSTGKEGSTDLPGKQQNTCDHEYEPIQIPRSASQPPDGRSYATETKNLPVEAVTQPPEVKSQPAETVSQPLETRSHPLEVNVKREEEDRYEVVRPQEEPVLQEATANLQVEGGYEIVEEPKKQEPKRYIRIPNEDAIIVPLHGSSDEEINPDRYLNPSLMMSEAEIESLPHTMSFNQTEEIPNDETKPHDATIQERIKTQADRFTTKLKGISKPNINIRKPKMKLPERPNIKMPEIPKIKLPDTSKFHLPERPKFHLPERPKFHLPDRSKFHLPDKPKFLTERPKFKLPERPKFTRGEKKPKAPKGKKPNPSSLRRPLRDVVTISSQSTPGSTNNIFETLKFRTYPRFFKKKKTPVVQKMSSLETESSQPSTPPTRPRSYSGQQQDTSWVHAYRDVKFADEDSNLRVERMEVEYEKEENTAPFHDNFDGGVRNMVEREFKQGKAESMTSVVSEKGSSGSSSVRRRAGVIEEIDSDEFFLREKGLSREDVDVSRYLSLEIRDAFRQPKNALASLDSELYDDEEHEVKFEHSPRAPQRSKPKKSSSFEKEHEFHTFPKRPSRRKESDPEIVVKPPRRFRSSSTKSGSRYRGRQSSMPSLNSDLDMVPPEPPRRKSRERSIKSLNREDHVSYHDEDNVQNRETAQHSVEIPPVAPLRKSRSRGTSLADDDRTSRGADSLILPDDDELHNQNHEDREEVEEEIMLEDEEEVKEEFLKEEPYKEVESVTLQETLKVEERSVDNSGYAVVAKDRKKPPRPPPPPQQQHQQHFHFQSQLDSIKNTGKNIFFTYPRRAIKSLHKQPPARPIRNYSTLGPVRPPRRNRVFRQPLYMTGENPPQQESFVDKERDLQSGDVVNRMKGRPLPPPPRPPRKTKDLDSFIESERVENIPTETIIATTTLESEEEMEPETKVDRLSYLQSKKDEFFNTFQKYRPVPRYESGGNVEEEIIQTAGEKQTTTAQQTSFDFGEVSVSIQTDPLPKDVIVIDQEIEETEEILILPESRSKESIAQRTEKILPESPIKTRSPIELKERRITESTQKKEESHESPETNIFQHALERVEAARGVLKEARERVIPGSTSSLDRKSVEEKVSPSTRVSQRESLPTSERSDDLEKEGTPPPLPARPFYTKPIPVSFPDKLHLSELDVDTLNVSEIQANKIKVSEIESTCIDVTELTSRGGNLTLNGVELPPDFISNIVAQVAAQHAQQQQHQAQSQQLQRASRESTPQRQLRRVLTPPPSILVHATQGEVLLAEPKVPQTDVTEHLPQPKTTKSKGRKLQTRVIDDSEDELASTLTQRREREQEKETKKKNEEKGEEKHHESLGPTLRQASSLQLLGRLLSIWQDQVVQGTGTFVQGVNSLFPEGEKRRDAQIAAVILLILITGLILLGFGFDNSVHHHHWDYLPPR